MSPIVYHLFMFNQNACQTIAQSESNCLSTTIKDRLCNCEPEMLAVKCTHAERHTWCARSRASASDACNQFSELHTPVNRLISLLCRTRWQLFLSATRSRYTFVFKRHTDSVDIAKLDVCISKQVQETFHWINFVLHCIDVTELLLTLCCTDVKKKQKKSIL